MIGYRMPTRVHVAPGCRARLPEVLAALDVEGVVLVVDLGLTGTPWPKEVARLVRDAGFLPQVVTDIEPNPRTTTAYRIGREIGAEERRAVVALGGGSTLDAAKAAAMLATNPGSPESYEGVGRYSEPPQPLVAIPTTCGTGSEVTWVSVLSHEPSRRKISVKGESMFPRQALVDADLVATLPAELVASTGLDGLTHAVEATTCTRANPVSDALAEKAVALLFAYLERAAADVAGDGEAREAVMRAATIAGLAFGNADVAAVHCLSESIGGLFDVPHGLANAMLLAPVLRSHRPHVDARLAELEDVVAPAAGSRQDLAERAGRFLSRLDELTRRLAVPPFRSFGIDPADHPAIAEQAAANGSNGSNPRPMAAADYLEILGRLG